MKKLLFLLVLNLLTSIVPASGSSLEQQLRLGFRELVNDNRTLNSIAEAQGFFDSERKQIVIDHTKKVFTHPEIQDYVIKHMLNVGMNFERLSKLSAKEQQAYGHALVVSLLTHAELKGISRLSPDLQRDIIRHKRYLLDNVSSSSCRAIVFGGNNSETHR